MIVPTVARACGLRMRRRLRVAGRQAWFQLPQTCGGRASRIFLKVCRSAGWVCRAGTANSGSVPVARNRGFQVPPMDSRHRVGRTRQNVDTDPTPQKRDTVESESLFQRLPAAQRIDSMKCAVSIIKIRDLIKWNRSATMAHGLLLVSKPGIAGKPAREKIPNN